MTVWNWPVMFHTVFQFCHQNCLKQNSLILTLIFPWNVFLTRIKHRLRDILGWLIQVWKLISFWIFLHPLGLLISPHKFLDFLVGQEFFLQVYFFEIILCFTLINVLKYCTYLRVWLWWFLRHDIYNYSSELFVVKASKFLHNFIFLIILCWQFLKHCGMFQLLMSFWSKYQNM